MKNLILLHGAIGTKDQLEQLKSDLSSNFNVYSFDFDGHGGNESNIPFSIDLFTENLNNFIIENAIDSPCIFGYSMGGYVAMNYVLKYQNSIDKIITYGTKFDWNPETSIKESKMLDPLKSKRKYLHLPIIYQKSILITIGKKY